MFQWLENEIKKRNQSIAFKAKKKIDYKKRKFTKLKISKARNQQHHLFKKIKINLKLKLLLN